LVYGAILKPLAEFKHVELHRQTSIGSGIGG